VSPIAQILPVLASALVLGFAGSVHCIGMCGGIAGALAQADPGGSRLAAGGRALLHSMGRITSYAIAGGLAGTFGAFFTQLGSRLGGLRILVGGVLVLLGIQLFVSGRALADLERAGARLFRWTAPIARRIGPPDRPLRIFATGLLWGWLPCGLVYSALVLAAASGGALSGALAMAGFGAGTLPALLAASGLGATLARIGGGRSVQRTAGALLVVFGLWSIAGAWAFAGGGGHVHVH
jgi:uncharacterized protein